MATELADSDAPTTGTLRLTDWITDHKNTPSDRPTPMSFDATSCTPPPNDRPADDRPGHRHDPVAAAGDPRSDGALYDRPERIAATGLVLLPLHTAGCTL